MSDYSEYNDIPLQETDDTEAPVQYFCKFTFAQFFTIMVLAVFSLGFMFYLGARYGNDYLRLGSITTPQTAFMPVSSTPNASSGETTDEMLKVAREALQQQQAQRMEGQINEAMQNPDVMRQLAAQSAGAVAPAAAVPPQAVAIPTGASDMNQQAQPAAVSAVQPQVDTVVSQTANPRANDYVPQPVPNAMPTADNAPAQPALPAAAPTGAQFSIQVGASQNVTEANQWVQAWRDRGYSAFLMTADLPEKGRWYRVRLGSFPNKESADSFASQLKTKEQVDAIVVTNE